jgi:calcium and integrin-binding protein 1
MLMKIFLSFSERVCESFSKDGYGNLNFEEFLDCLSVFSEHAPRDLKIYYAFRIYDYDGDDVSHADKYLISTKILF